jgi:hypothetical protein
MQTASMIARPGMIARQIDGLLIGDDALDRFVCVTTFAVSALSRTVKNSERTASFHAVLSPR